MVSLTNAKDLTFSGSYDPSDVIFLLKPAKIAQTETEEKERLIQSGAKHYSEMLSAEKVPSKAYMDLYHDALERNASIFRGDIQILAKAIAARPETAHECTIVSLARAGTPIGVLLTRELRRMGVETAHYSISIIRDRGIDLEAMKTILDRHRPKTIVFVDGWTGKGAIKGELERTLAASWLPVKPFLAVVADPAGRADLAATYEDYVIPSGLLNGIVSGLVSRTVLNEDYVGPGDYHACLFMEENAEHDISRQFIETIEATTPTERTAELWNPYEARISRNDCGRLIRDICQDHGIDDINRIKPGIAEATRAVLRRVPDAVYVNDLEDPAVRHIIHLALENAVPIHERDLGSYRALTIIKSVGGSQE